MLRELGDLLRAFAAGLDAGTAIRHGVAVPEGHAARRRGAPGPASYAFHGAECGVRRRSRAASVEGPVG